MNFFALITALLTLFPHMSGNNRQCIIHTQARIVQVLQMSQQQYPNVQPEVLFVVGFIETHLGCDANEGGGWGVPISRNRRHTAGPPVYAAMILNRGLEVCGNIHGAVHRFRTGLCRHRRNWGSLEYRRMAEIGNRYERLVFRRVRDLQNRILVIPTRELTEMVTVQ